MAANNDLVLLNHIIEEERMQRYPDVKPAEFFEQYVAEQVLKDFDLSDEEIEYGLTGGGHDGGIDGLFTFVNGELVREDFDYSTLKKQIVIDVFVLQSKMANGFEEEPINKAIASTKHLLDLSIPLEKFREVYNQQVLDLAELFRTLVQEMARRFPRIIFHFVYATRGNEVHPNVRRKTEDLAQVISSLSANYEFKFNFIGAGDLLELARKQPTTTFQLPYVEQLTGRDGYIALVKLTDFYSFVRNENGSLRKTLFEANVRDYQGKNPVNEEVQQTLVSGGPEEFWWLNNGITIVATQSNLGNKVLTLEDPQIVNGQQTSTEIFNYCSSYDTSRDDRCVMVRVIYAEDSTSRDKIIKATNRQTAMPDASLRATEKIHRDIEEYLRRFDLYYDRRKNSQRQQGHPSSKIVSIGFVAQALMSILLQRPNDARARPSSMIKKDSDYVQIFSEEIPIHLYYVASKIVKMIQALLRQREDFESKARINVVFYVAMLLAAEITKAATPSANQLSKIELEKVRSDLANQCIDVVYAMYLRLGGDDKAAKGNALTEELTRHLRDRFPYPTK